MFRRHIGCLVAVAAALLGVSVCFAPSALADPSWNGRYAVTFWSHQKSGTSVAASQSEPSYTEYYTVGSSCSAGRCVATVTNGPAQTNPTTPAQPQFTWDGTSWTSSSTFRWACLLPDGTIEWNPAGAAVSYTPKPDGTLTGSFHADISSGTCQGTVDMPIEAVPG